MQYPERPTCHDTDWQAQRWNEHLIWREGATARGDPGEDPYGAEPFRSCGYCGSIHPEDLTRALEAGATLGGSDWKYGWPHKFYVEGIPNPKAGAPVAQYIYCGTRDQLGPNAEPSPHGTGWREKRGEWPAPATRPAKWYNQHVLDVGFDEEALTRLLMLLAVHSGITFRIEDGKLMYAAPHQGYQR